MDVAVVVRLLGRFARVQDRTVTLHFGAVDEQAWVYVNGERVGEHTVESEGAGVGQLWDRPFAISVPPDKIRPGEDNLLAVRTHASVGASGIWKPVTAYLAALRRETRTEGE